MGVTAEDMQNVETIEGLPVFALPKEGLIAHLAEVNIETMHLEKKLKDRQFDIIVSWVTMCWLSEQIGSMEMIYNVFLKPGGIMCFANMSLFSSDNCELSLQHFDKLATYLRNKGF